MKEAINEALTELKRADHMVFVSLKYTRTSEVMFQILERLETALLKMFEVLIEFGLAEEAKPSKEEFEKMSPVQESNLIKKYYKKDEIITEAIFMYNNLRRLRKKKFKGKNEFRRNVTMVFEDDDEEVTIDVITEYFENIKEYISYMIDLLNLGEENPLK